MKDFAHFIETHFFRKYIISCNRKTDVAKNLLLMVHIQSYTCEFKNKLLIEAISGNQDKL